MLDRGRDQPELTMHRRDFLLAAASLGAGSITPGMFGGAGGQTRYPNAPVTIFVPYAAGGASDILTRVVADYARSQRNVAVAVEFRPGAGGTRAQTVQGSTRRSLAWLYSSGPC